MYNKLRNNPEILETGTRQGDPISIEGNNYQLKERFQ